MPTSRFVVVPAPLEAQLTTSLSAQLREALSLALRLKRQVNATLHDEELGDKASSAVFELLAPGGLPFILLMLLVAVLAVRELLLRMETKRILKVHRDHSGVAMAPPTHEHDD